MSWTNSLQLKNHGCVSRHETLLQNELIVTNKLIYKNVMVGVQMVAVVKEENSKKCFWWLKEPVCLHPPYHVQFSRQESVNRNEDNK